MAYAPSRVGDLPRNPIAPRPPHPEEYPLWRPAADAALRFWIRLSDQLPPDSDLRPLAQQNATHIQAQQRDIH